MLRVIIDVREPFEYLQGHVDNAINIPLNKFSDPSNFINYFSKDSEIILYCRSGNRSNLAMKYLIDRGYKKVTNGINKKYIEATYH